MSVIGTVRFKLSLLATVAIGLPGAALAQTEMPADQMDVVVITGTPNRDSQEAAIEAKRDADNVVDIISADTIGRFPDQNLADSLGRLPGIAIERDQGQARYINFRGAPFRYTTIAFDGVDVPGAENGRVPRFDSIPSVVTRAVEANKAVTPNMPGESVAGYVNIRTFDPFEYDGFSASLEAGYGEQELGGGPVNKYNGRISYSDGQFGLMVYGSTNSRMQATDNREFDLEIDPVTDMVVVNELDFRSYYVEREDNAYGGRLEYRMDGPLQRIFLSTLYSEFIDKEERNQFVFDFAGGAAAVSGTVTPGETGYQPVVLVTRLLEYGKYDNSTATTTLGSDFDLSGWDVQARLNFTKTENNLFLPIPYSAGGTTAASYDVSNVLSPQVTLFGTGTQTPRALETIAYAANLGLIVNSSLDNEAVKFKVDASTDTDWFTGDTTFAIGAQYDNREAEGVAVAQGIGGFPATVNIGDYRTTTPWRTDFDNTIGATYYDNTGLRAAWEAAIGGFSTAAPADQIIAIDEQILSAYAMATTHFDGGNLVYGARVESTDYTSDGPAIDVSYSDDYVTFLPSVHANFDLTDDLKLRLSATTGLSRPTYNELRASAAVNPTNQTVIGGNPTLDAETTWGVDASLEWYFAPASLLSAAAFHRNIDDVIYADSTTVDGGIYLPSAAGQDWTLTGFVNGGEGHLSGLEFNLLASATDILPEPFDGLGVNANLTLLNSEFETNSGTKFSLPGTSETIFNASLYYEKFGFSARVNYQYRDAWLSTTENDSLGEYWDAQERVDLSLRYLLPFDIGGAHSTLFANVNNLTDEKDVRYIETTRTPNQYEGYGRYWVAGIRFDY